MILSDQKPFLSDIDNITSRIEEYLDENGVPFGVITQFGIAVDELYSNIVYYSGAERASVSLELASSRVEMVFTDDGKEFDPVSRVDPDVSLSAEERGVGGMGIFLVKKFMDRMEYHRVDGKNVLTLSKSF